MSGTRLYGQVAAGRALDGGGLSPFINALLLIGVAATLVAVFYAHVRLGDFVRGRGRTLGLRIFLVLLGLCAGGMAVLVSGASHPVPVFLTAFGTAHVPPAIVLFLKSLRGERRS